MTKRRAGRGLACVLLLAATPAFAQHKACALPEHIPSPRIDRQQGARRVMPIEAHILALSWSPQYCQRARKSDAFQCGSNRFGFVLHGLWPQGRGGGEPQYCRPAQALPATLLRSNLCATPSVDLLQHEWAKHGTCMSSSPQHYFDQARRAYEQIRFPDMARLATTRGLTVGGFTTAFVAANGRTLARRSIKVRLSRDGWLQEVQLCLDRQLKSVTCRPQGRAPSAAQAMRIRPPR